LEFEVCELSDTFTFKKRFLSILSVFQSNQNCGIQTIVSNVYCQVKCKYEYLFGMVEEIDTSFGKWVAIICLRSVLGFTVELISSTYNKMPNPWQFFSSTIPGPCGVNLV